MGKVTFLRVAQEHRLESKLEYSFDDGVKNGFGIARKIELFPIGCDNEIGLGEELEHRNRRRVATLNSEKNHRH
jgi:hypothetical protein